MSGTAGLACVAAGRTQLRGPMIAIAIAIRPNAAKSINNFPGLGTYSLSFRRPKCIQYANAAIEYKRRKATSCEPESLMDGTFSTSQPPTHSMPARPLRLHIRSIADRLRGSTHFAFVLAALH